MIFGGLGRFGYRFRFAIIAFWLILAGALTVFVQPLDKTVAQSPVSFIPANAPVLQGYSEMKTDFGGQGSNGLGYVIFQNTHGLTADDFTFIHSTVLYAQSRPDMIASVTDFFAQPQLRPSYVSADNTTAYIFVGMKADLGTQQSSDQVATVRAWLHTHQPSDMQTWLTGDPGIISDFENSVTNGVNATRMITLLLVVVILLFVYRSPVSLVIPLITIGVAYGVARGVVSLAGLHGLHVSPFTDSFLIAIVFGAGTDYCLFLTARLKEELANGAPFSTAIVTTVHRVGEALASSAATVILGGFAMGATNLALFNTTGPAVAIAVAVTLLVGLTLTPAMMAIGQRFLFWPQGVSKDKPGRLWTGIARLVSVHPTRVATASLAGLLICCIGVPLMSITYDQLSPQPSSDESVRGVNALAGHFDTGEVFPIFLMIKANHDVRNPVDLLALDSATAAVSRVNGIALARSFSRPEGHPIAELDSNTQLQQLATKLSQAGAEVNQQLPATGGANQLITGSGRLASGLDQANSEVAQKMPGIYGATGMLANAQTIANEADAETAAGTAELNVMTGNLTTAIGTIDGELTFVGEQQTTLTNDLLQLQSQGKNLDSLYTLNKDDFTKLKAESADLTKALADLGSREPAAQKEINKALDAAGTIDLGIVEMQVMVTCLDGQALPPKLQALLGSCAAQGLTGLQGLESQLQGFQTTLATQVAELINFRSQLVAAQGGIGKFSGQLQQMAGNIAGMKSQFAQDSTQLNSLVGDMNQLQGGLSQLDSGAHQLQGGVNQLGSDFAALPSTANQLESGLSQASDFLSTYANSAQAAGVQPFYLPSDQYNNDNLALARALYVSQDGTALRLILLTHDDPYSTAAVQDANNAVAAVDGVLNNSSLKGSTVSIAGVPAEIKDIQNMAGQDYLRVFIAVLAGVFLVLVLLLRSFVAPLYLLASVVLSYAASQGILVLVFQGILHEPIDWTVPIFVFVMLVAVGADYNIFLMSRVREEIAKHGKDGIPRAVQRTGRVITSAGLIFAGTFIAMMTAGIRPLVETGFAVSVGLLIDTFVVRSLLVPAVAVLFGKYNWWPGKPPTAATVPVEE